MRYVRYTLIGMLWLILTSCTGASPEDKVRELLNKSHPEYDQERQVIYFKEELDHDIKADIAFPLHLNSDHKLDFNCQLSFFNYGQDIRLYNGIEEDWFSSEIGDINCAYVLNNNDDIEVIREKRSEKYGDWALANLMIDNNYVNEVFMTPLALKAFKEGNTRSFIFIQFLTRYNFMNVLFYGGPKECLIVMDYPNLILTRCTLSHSGDDTTQRAGQFWRQLPDEYDNQ